MSAPTTAELLERISALERSVADRAPSRSPVYRRKRSLTVLGAGLLALLVPTTILASHLFTDVPTGGTFHNVIAKIYGARITTGCGPGAYCPTNPVTREQMAGFLNRGLGRIAYAEPNFIPLTGAEAVVNSATIRAGNVQGGTAFVHVEASGYAFTTITGESDCQPCIAEFIVRSEDGQTSWYGLTTISNISADTREFDSFAISWVVEVPTGVDFTFSLHGTQTWGLGAIQGVGTIALTYVPFGPDGGNTLDALGPTRRSEPRSTSPTGT